MPVRLLLVSTNLAVAWLERTVRALASDCGRAAVVTTAEPIGKERSRNAMLARAAVAGAGVARQTYFDFDERPATELDDFDCVVLASGNPFYLLGSLHRSGGDEAIERFLASGRPLLACGAGALVLGRSLWPVRAFDSSVSPLGTGHPAALSLVPYSLLIHANRWRSRLVDYAARLESVRNLCGPVVELDDDEALLGSGAEPVRLAA
ncbi:MAG: Type 1 glutamine amidotransferase-like domain-containing protein [Verrucomicrobia bacterium]|nr:Type 1 glutamine amidotransferase-like domain-containing protein [Verrucomicrobiota bacterium]